MPKNLDPQNIGPRLYKQVGVLLDQLETGTGVTLKERYMALAAIARIQAIFQAIRLKDSRSDEPTAGSAVRKYASAFEAHDTRRRKKVAGLAAAATDEFGDDDLLRDLDEDRDTAS